MTRKWKTADITIVGIKTIIPSKMSRLFEHVDGFISVPSLLECCPAQPQYPSSSLESLERKTETKWCDIVLKNRSSSSFVFNPTTLKTIIGECQHGKEQKWKRQTLSPGNTFLPLFILAGTGKNRKKPKTTLKFSGGRNQRQRRSERNDSSTFELAPAKTEKGWKTTLKISGGRNQRQRRSERYDSSTF